MIIAPDGTFSYADLDRAEAAVADVLLDGAPDLREARVAYFIPPSFAHVATMRGIWRAGGVAVPLAISHPPAELDYVIRDSEASIVVVDPECAPMVAPLAKSAGARVLDSSQLVPTSGDSSGRQVRLMPDFERQLRTSDVNPIGRALIVYTSGTTGRPKGVVTTHGNLAAQIDSLVAAWEWTSRDRTLLVLPLHHVHGIVNVVGCAVNVRATLEMHRQFDAEAAWARLASGEITVFTAVPTIYRRLIQSWEAAGEEIRARRSDGCRRARLMMSGSAALPLSTLDRWREISGHTLLERYGMTELGMALSNPLHGERLPGSVGRPLPGVDARVVDERGSPVAEGTPGELEVRGPNVFLEYWRRPDETRRAFRDGWFRTGDVAVVHRGAYRLLGRTSVDIIKTGGYKVSALEIEEVIREHAGVADCAVVGISDPEWGERVCAAVELRPGCTMGIEELQSWTKPRLAPYKVPKSLCCVPALPRNAMGKVVKPEVVKLFEDRGVRS